MRILISLLLSCAMASNVSYAELLSNLVYAEEIKRRPGWVVRSLLR